MNCLTKPFQHLLAGLLFTSATITTNAFAHSNEVYELRTYTANEGKLEQLHNRFREHTMTMFRKHGMRNVAYWVPLDTPNTLIYIVAHTSEQAAAASWEAFIADPAWQRVYKASIADGRLVKNIDKVFLSKTDYSP